MTFKAMIGLAISMGTLALACSGCTTVATNTEYERDPIYAAHLALGHDEEQLMALPSIDIEIPGIAGDQTFLEKVEMKYGLRYTDGTSPGEIAYAKSYNREIMRLRGCNMDKPMDRCAR